MMKSEKGSVKKKEKCMCEAIASFKVELLRSKLGEVFWVRAAKQPEHDHQTCTGRGALYVQLTEMLTG